MQSTNSGRCGYFTRKHQGEYVDQRESKKGMKKIT
jgi:hypothetical protein